MKLHAQGEIEKPIAEVFRFYADEHVRNHPRWDPDVQLEAASDGPLGVGSVIHRRVNRMGRVSEGTMKITEFERDRAMAAEVDDGGARMYGRATFEALGPHRTRLTLDVDAPMIQDPNLKGTIEAMMQRSLANIARLVVEE